MVLPPVMIEMQERDPLTSSLFITDIGYYPKAKFHHRVRKDAIDQYVLIYCVEGSGYYVLDGERQEVEANQYFILPAGKPHEYGAHENGEWTIYWVHFRGAHAPIYAEGAQTPQKINVSLTSRISERINIFEEILTTLHFGENIIDFRYVSSLLHYFLASMRFLGQYRRGKSDKWKEEVLNRNIVEAAIHFMEENIEHHISVDDVLRFVGYSQSHFSMMFKKETGHSPLAYFNRLKVDYACKILRETDLKINQICYKIGFGDPLYFSRLFCKVKGMSPSQYRQLFTISERNC